MINTENFVKKLESCGVGFFTGVPDSLLKTLGNYFYENITEDRHIITANEGNAIALAAGNYLATGNIPLVYLQNSGLGNTVNPLLSMADSSLYAIPMLIFVGWRGQGGTGDAEQHLVQGPATPRLIEAMGYSYVILSKDEATAFQQIEEATKSFETKPQPYFFVVEKESFEKYPLINKPASAGDMSREDALRIIAESLPSNCFVVSTTGKTSREWYEVREQLGQSHNKDFLTVGSMGHTSSIALGMALGTDRSIVCIDGDGSLLMHMGAAVLAGHLKRSNLKYVLVNNFSHESVGGLPTPLEHVDFESFFKAVGFKTYFRAKDQDSLKANIKKFINSYNSVLEVRVRQGSREDLSRPDKKAGELTKMIREEFKI